MVSKTQIDQLGDRLRTEIISESDLRTLDEYRRSFADAYESVVSTIRTELALDVTGRPAKSTTSIREKLLRESIRLSQIQDIAGCRVIVVGVKDQEIAVDSIRSLFREVVVVDRREKPSNGYRAVHVIVKRENRTIEIQVRTILQHSWAELSEKASDVIDPRIKYGGGHEGVVKGLLRLSSLVANEESEEFEVFQAEARVSRFLAAGSLAQNKELQDRLDELHRMMRDWSNHQSSIREKMFQSIRDAFNQLSNK